MEIPWTTYSTTQTLITRLTNDADIQWISTTIDELIRNKSNGLTELEIFHAILKRSRKNMDHQLGEYLLSCLANHSQLEIWIVDRLSCQDMTIVPFLVCMIDMVKSDSRTADPIMAYLASHVDMICNQWRAQHITVVRRSLELVKRLLSAYCNTNLYHHVLVALESYVGYLQQHLLPHHVRLLSAVDRTEFFYEAVCDTVTLDRECVKQLIQMALTLLSFQPNDSRMLLAKIQHLHIQQHEHEWNLPDILFDFYSNDEDAVELQHAVLLLYTNNADPLRPWMDAIGVTPHTMFLHFLDRTGMDPSMLVDLLISNETEFLVFFLAYLKHIQSDLGAFTNTCSLLLGQDSPSVVCSEVLNPLVPVLTSTGFPYNASALVHRLQDVISRIQ